MILLLSCCTISTWLCFWLKMHSCETLVLYSLFPIELYVARVPCHYFTNFENKSRRTLVQMSKLHRTDYESTIYRNPIALTNDDLQMAFL